MDNLTHTLAGLAMARSGLGRASALGTTALVVGSNLPDMDLLWSYTSRVGYIEYHRGWTHSVCGIALLAPLLTLVLYGLGRRGNLAVRGGPLFGLALLGVAGHLGFDALNSYGVRPFLPWSNTWLYQDLVAIIDPWVWLILSSAALLAVRPKRWDWAMWVIAAAATSFLILVLGAALTPAWMKAAWLVGLGAITVLSAWTEPSRRFAQAGLAAFGIYVGARAGFHAAALAELKAATNDLPGRTTVACLPDPADPFRWQGLACTAETLGRGEVNLFAASTALHYGPRHLNEPEVQRALQTREAQALLRFARFPMARTAEDSSGSWVTLFDARFGGEPAFARVIIRVNRSRTAIRSVFPPRGMELSALRLQDR